MIRAILVVGWVGLALLLATGATGYRVSDAESAQGHLVGSLFAAAALFFVDLCLVVYLQGTRLLVRRTVAELSMPSRWQAEHGPLALRGTLAALLAALALGATFAAGFPTYAGSLDRWVHHALAGLAAVLQLGALLVGARVLRRGEAQLAALGREVETVRYTPPTAASGAGPHSATGS